MNEPEYLVPDDICGDRSITGSAIIGACVSPYPPPHHYPLDWHEPPRVEIFRKQQRPWTING